MFTQGVLIFTRQIGIALNHPNSAPEVLAPGEVAPTQAQYSRVRVEAEPSVARFGGIAKTGQDASLDIWLAHAKVLFVSVWTGGRGGGGAEKECVSVGEARTGVWE